MTGYGRSLGREAVDAINRGHVYYYLLKPWAPPSRSCSRSSATTREVSRPERAKNRDTCSGKLRAQLTPGTFEEARQRAQNARAWEWKKPTKTCFHQRTREAGWSGWRAPDGNPYGAPVHRRGPWTRLGARFELKRHARLTPARLTLGYIDVAHFKQESNTDYLLTGGRRREKGVKGRLGPPHAERCWREGRCGGGRVGGGRKFLVNRP